jgi:hypothetical protein
LQSSGTGVRRAGSGRLLRREALAARLPPRQAKAVVREMRGFAGVPTVVMIVTPTGRLESDHTCRPKPRTP